MRSRVVAFLVVACLAATSPAIADGFFGVHSSNGIEVWAVGNSGTVFRSVDGGVTWTTLSQGSSTLRAVFTMNDHVWVAGDNGSYYSSANGGASWNTATLAGGASLRAIAFTDHLTGWIAGGGGTILTTTNGGSSWTSQSSTTTQQLNAVCLTSAQVGYAGGAGGTLLKTTSGGSTWTTVAQTGWTKDILSVSESGQTVYVAGADGFCSKSTDGGASWSELAFTTDTRADVNCVCAVSAADAYFTGGGGFIRFTTDGGSTFSYGIHQLHATLNNVFFYTAQNGWACGEKTNIVLRTTDGGASWQLPQGTSVTYQWIQKFSGASIGNTFCVNPWNKDIIYVVMGNTVYMSGDRGDSWRTTATIPSGGSTWSFYVSPKDTNLWVAATSGGPDSTGKGVRRSTNRGITWTTRLRRNFTTYGMPLEMDPDHPDTVIFAAEGTGSGPDGILYISTDFGGTWDTLAQTSFRSPCDIVIVPGNSSLWFVGDGTTGSGQAQMWRSTNYGHTWTSIYSSPSSEIPMIAVSRLRNSYAFATAWGSTSFTRSTNSGLTWSNIASTTSTWGTDIAKDDPNVVVYGTYGLGTSYLSTNAGDTFNSISLSGSNSGMLAYDRATILAHEAGSGVLKLAFTYGVPTVSAQIIAVDSPNGGEAWGIGTTQSIRWSSTGVSGSVKIDLSRDGGVSYETLYPATANDGGEFWTVTGPPCSSALIRVSSVSNPAIVDSSNGTFAIGTLFSLLERLKFHDNGGESDSLEWGTAAGATDGIDALFGEIELPPVPPLGAFDVRWQIAGTEGTKRDTRDTLGGTHQQAIYTGRLQAGEGGYPFVLWWNRSELPSGSFTLRDGFGGTVFTVDMKQQDSLVIANDGIDLFEIVYDANNGVTSSVEAGWNMVSLPVTVADRRKAVVFPSSISGAFAYTPTGYMSRDTLKYGAGYWLKFPNTQSILLTGGAIEADTIVVVQGWNMIGSISTSVPIGSIIQIPTGIVTSQYFGFSGGSYVPSLSINPMRSYWVKVNQNGTVVLFQGANKGAKRRSGE